MALQFIVHGSKWPSSDELGAVVPDAKVLLTERNTISQMTLMDKAFHVILGWTSSY